MKNIEIFRELSGLVLAKAYDSFPLDVTIRPTELALALGDERWDESQRSLSENHSEYIQNRSPIGLAAPTVRWLMESGFLSYESYKDGAFVGVRLTAKGLESIESKKGRGAKLVNAVAGLAKEELKNQAKTQLSKAFAEVTAWSIKNVPTIVANISKVSGI
ncbi:hypothetical protein [Pseudomonas gingeri]|uniref:hypothetical protein n=1 Tax=Pseudomonas gingeri TaxID=117681 RepID=UPI0015A37B5F|nr:hypothetical protein [Pseudomonas gingeri]NWD07728.1 hypothetical protein [Pseudomonas gingeri]NWE32483.1 hypothetical protein [Pseudomonas gingeri]NWE55277.1 hypothetical protein [Pseudomonas gingeri]NWF00543.1 hypothetical protein [Pseudomonas gingeri]